MTFAEIKADVFRRLAESSSAPVYWTESDVEDAINEGYAEISDATEWREVPLTIDLLKDRPYYDLRTVAALDATILSVKAVYNPQTTRWLEPSRVSDLDRYDRRWESRTGQAERFFLRGLWWLGLWPRTATESGTVETKVTTLPAPLVNDSDVPGFAATLHRGLVEFALADLWAQDGETTKALQAWQAYLAYETALAGYTDGRLRVPLVQGDRP